MDPESDPVESYEALLTYRPPTIDFLLPHANWSTPPRSAAHKGPVPYGDWLVRLFDRWYDAPRQETDIRLLSDLVHLILGGTGGSEQIGLSPVALAVIESDGAIDQVDSLKSAYSGAPTTGLNIASHTFDDALRHPGIVARQIGIAALHDDCRSCPVHQICGAGHYAHRYRRGSGFRHPSVYCADLLRIIDHVRTRVAADLVELRSRVPV